MEQVTGRVTANAKVATLESGKEVVNFSIATNRKYVGKDGELKEVTRFIECAFWRNTNVAPYITKGKVVELSGDFGARAYLKDGEPVAVITLNVREIQLHGGNPADPKPAPQPVKKKAGKKEAEEDLPF